MGSFSIWHWLIVLAIVLVLFGTKKLRNVGGDLGGVLKSFKDTVKNFSAPCIDVRYIVQAGGKCGTLREKYRFTLGYQ